MDDIISFESNFSDIELYHSEAMLYSCFGFVYLFIFTIICCEENILRPSITEKETLWGILSIFVSLKNLKCVIIIIF